MEANAIIARVSRVYCRLKARARSNRRDLWFLLTCSLLMSIAHIVVMIIGGTFKVRLVFGVLLLFLLAVAFYATTCICMANESEESER